MTEDEIQERRVRYERFRDESVYTGTDMLRLLEAVEAVQRNVTAITRERDMYFEQMTQAMADRGQSVMAALHHQAQTERLLELLATLFPSSFERDVTMPDDAPQEWTLLIELPTGQVAFPWGDPEGLTAPIPFNQGRVYDGHTLAEREARIRALMERMTERQEGTSVPREFATAYAAGARKLLALTLTDAFVRAVGTDLFAASGVVAWRQRKLPPVSDSADLYQLQMRVVASGDSLLPDTPTDDSLAEALKQTLHPFEGKLITADTKQQVLDAITETLLGFEPPHTTEEG